MRQRNTTASRSLSTLLAMCVIASAHAQTTQESVNAPAAAAVELPEAADIVAKSATATGAAAMRGHKSLAMTSTLEIQGMGIKGSVKSFLASPNRSSQVTVIPGIGEFQTGFDGKTGWMLDPINGPRVLSGTELLQMTREADFFKDVDPGSQWEELRTTGSQEFKGFDCWVIAAKRGTEKSTLYFEKDKGFLRGTEMEMESPMGKIPVVAFIKEYKDFQGVQLPAISMVTQAGQTVALTIETAEFDTVPQTQFELPKVIAALLLADAAESEEDDAESDSAVPPTPTKPAAPSAPATPVTPATPATPKD